MRAETIIIRCASERLHFPSLPSFKKGKLIFITAELVKNVLLQNRAPYLSEQSLSQS